MDNLFFADESVSGYEFVPESANVDFCLKIKGTSMINARIYDGDIVFIRKQSDVDNGEIAVVLIDSNEAKLKRVYKVNGNVILRPENPEFPDQVYSRKEFKSVRIIGKAIFFQSGVR